MFFSVLVPTMGTREVELNRLFESLSLQEFNDFEVVVVSQINHSIIEELVARWSAVFLIKHIKLEKAGLSYARNNGLAYCEGNWVILSDDDAWYPENALSQLKQLCTEKYQIVLTQIFDPIRQESYKDYEKNKRVIRNAFQLMSKSSIEIAFNRKELDAKFDERFGLGAQYVCGEEVDFLLRSFKKNNICYYPFISVYHEKKSRPSTDKQQFAKGALYAKNCNLFVARLIYLRDLCKRRDYKSFWAGYKDYKKINKNQ